VFACGSWYEVQKVQTVKDLNIPWSKLPGLKTLSASATLPSAPPHPDHTKLSFSQPSSPPPDSSSSPATSSSPPKESYASLLETHSSAQSGPFVHSALTTVLLDDSPLKAVRQPYNHVCIPEYDAKKRAHDLGVFMKAKARLEEQEYEEMKAAAAARADDLPEGQDADVDAGIDAEEDKDASRKRKRKERKLRKREEKLAKSADVIKLAQEQAELQDAHKEEQDGEDYDLTLLAVIGVLDEIKHQRNVAAWIHAGGLWGPGGAPSVQPPVTEDASNLERGGQNGAGFPVEKVDEDGRDASTRKRARHDTKASAADLPTETPVENDGLSTIVPGSDQAREPAANSIAVTAQPSSRREKSQKYVVQTQPMWFEDPAALLFWVQRGKKALESLGLAVDHGIER
jgi:hypothetical protein